ncbi:hypothetical protein PISMIDRAFT_673208 [Pisolithus microcarpus 441]|uniref:DUF6533 domain-containing protein n=1 Tax=Pisolithus microcarpus 441 TaxID=765257 RepID=A0A0D0AAD7_9AGAM|nr:hypothetical protein BKA83DRAFT_673208 [Pisolithus microcarpus]KIK28933.1 hypothetical protein PISMIDRAFT_673208 [Pisolithus microcarpus 441]
MSSLASADYSLLMSASQHYREFQFAMITLMLYDHAITLGEEIDFFWRGPLSLSKVLYLLIRYLALALSASLFFATFSMSIVIIQLCQAVVTLRVWYLFSRNAFVRTFVVGTLCGSTAASFAFLVPFVGGIENLFIFQMPLQNPGKVIWVFAPALINHSILFALKVYRFMQGGKSLHMEAPSRRLFKEGMLMYAFATVSLVFSIVCLTFTAYSQISVFLFALASFPTASIVVAVCRAMLSIRSLAATFHVDPEWLLSNAEMSRLPLREGPNKSELCVEIFCPQ